MKLTVENAIEIAKKYGFTYDEDLLTIIVPTNIYIDDGDFSFLRFEYGSEGFKYNCAYEFGLSVQESGIFGYHTTLFKYITTTEEFEVNIKNFLFFIELAKPLEKKYAEQVKLNKIDGDF